jgi:hypothetical protein
MVREYIPIYNDGPEIISPLAILSTDGNHRLKINETHHRACISGSETQQSTAYSVTCVVFCGSFVNETAVV